MSKQDESKESIVNSGVNNKGIRFPIAGIVLIILILFSLFYYKQSFSSLKTRDSMDIAQIARLIESGNGFTSHLIRPLNTTIADTIGTEIDELNHGPLFPYAVSSMFLIRGVSDQAAGSASLVFFILAIIGIYYGGKLLFNSKTGLLAAAIFTISTPLLKTAISGEEWTMAAFLMSLLLIIIGRYHSCDDSKIKRVLLLILAAFIAALLYLVSYVFCVFAICTAVYFVVTDNKGWASSLVFLVIWLAMVSPWIYKNWELTKSPVLGVIAWDIMADTTAYPGDSIYRTTDTKYKNLSSAVFFPFDDFSSFAEKTLRNIELLGVDLLGMLGIIGVPFALVSSLYKYKNLSANAVRGLGYGFIATGLIVFSIFSVNKNSLIIFAPLIAIFGSGYFFLLIDTKKLHAAYVKVLITGIIIITAIPAVYGMIWKDSTDINNKNIESERLFASLGNRGTQKLIYTDIPWIAAWRTTAPAAWLPKSDKDVSELLSRGLPMSLAILTPECENYSPSENWYMLHKNRLWREYIKDPDNGTKLIMDEVHLTLDKEKTVRKSLDRTKRNFMINNCLKGIIEKHPNPLSAGDIQVFIMQGD